MTAAQARSLPQVTTCMGVCCEQHAQCRRYAAIEGQRSGPRIGSCVTDAGVRPLFVPIQPAPAPRREVA